MCVETYKKIIYNFWFYFEQNLEKNEEWCEITFKLSLRIYVIWRTSLVIHANFLIFSMSHYYKNSKFRCFVQTDFCYFHPNYSILIPNIIYKISWPLEFLTKLQFVKFSWRILHFKLSFWTVRSEWKIRMLDG